MISGFEIHTDTAGVKTQVSADIDRCCRFYPSKS